jgi:hypothetical protein
MTSECHVSNSQAASSSDPEPGQSLLDTAEELIWSLLDGQLSESNCQRLEQLILQHELVRQRYLECMQLHVDLQTVYDQGAEDAVLPALDSPVLGSLDGSLSGDFPNIEASPPCD